VTIVSILRLKYMIQFAATSNVTWDYLPIGYWSAVEAHVGAIVACLPSVSEFGPNRKKVAAIPTRKTAVVAIRRVVVAKTSNLASGYRRRVALN
jgi:hypothetical protein